MVQHPGHRSTAPEPGAPEVGLPEKVRALREPSIYPAPCDAVDVIETHMSWVFLAGDTVYKLKKPVRFAYLDFSELDARAAFVREEVRLNRRLAPEIYLGASALTRNPRGALEIDGAGEVVDWLVRMRRLPAELMLDTVIRKGAARQATAARVISVLAPFYAGAERPRTYPATRIARYADQFREDAAVLLDPYFELDGKLVSALCDRCDRDLVDLTLVLRAQASKRLLVDGHGDLRPEHICLSAPPVIFDCIDFDRALRIVDPFEEIAFLGMECARLGAPWMLSALHNGLSERLGILPGRKLMAFYWRARCMLRARLALAHLYDRDPRTPWKWRPNALRYLDLAEEAERITAPLAASDPRPAAGSHRRSRSPR